jgi:hypothetical protein
MNAFNGCTSLTGITFPAGESITIDSYAFTNCGFASITIPARVTFIAGSGFSNCAKLTTVIFEGAVTLIGDNNSFPNGQTLKTAYESGKAGTYVRNGTTNFDTWGKS